MLYATNLMLQIPSGTTRLDVGAMVTVSTAVMPCVMPYSLLLSPRKETPALIAGSRSRPADIFLPNWCGGRPAALDVTVTSPLHHLTLAGAASVRGHALQVAEDRKRAAHHANCGAAGVVFLPIAVEALGQAVGVRKLFFTFQKSVDSWGSGWGFLQTRL